MMLNSVMWQGGCESWFVMGYLGGAPVHLESSWCYDLGDAVYAKALLGDKQHWARTLPGGLLHNIISHGVSKIAEFLTSDTPHVIAHGFVSPFLKGLGENEIVDELRVIISEEQGTTAYFTFSSQMRPSLHQFHIYGPKNGLLIDEDQRILVKLRGDRFKSYAEHFIPPVRHARQYLANFAHNARLFLAMDFHMDSGKKYLFESFYRSIIDGTPVPIPYREILLTSRIMDAIFEQIAPGIRILQHDIIDYLKHILLSVTTATRVSSASKSHHDSQQSCFHEQLAAHILRAFAMQSLLKITQLSCSFK